MDLEKFTKLNAKSEGRDKIIKLALYLTKFLKYHAQHNPELFKSLTTSYEFLNLTRSGFRFGKWLFRFQEAYATLIEQSEQAPCEVSRVFQGLNKTFYAIYFFFDNIHLLTTSKLLSYDEKKMKYYAMVPWLLALTFGALNSLTRIYHLRQKKAATQQDYADEGLELARYLADMPTALNESGFSEKLFKTQINEGVSSLGSMLSAMIALQSLS